MMNFCPAPALHFNKPAIDTEAIMKTLMSITAAMTLLAALPVWACTPEEAQAKREQLAQEVQKLTQQNPAKAKELNQEIKDMQLETASKDLPDKCQLIDQRLKEMDEAAKKAEG
jgi:uncharacterized protein YlxW (UPF0749 family)